MFLNQNSQLLPNVPTGKPKPLFALLDTYSSCRYLECVFFLRPLILFLLYCSLLYVLVRLPLRTRGYLIFNLNFNWLKMIPLYFETGSHCIAQAGYSATALPSVGSTGIVCHTQLKFIV